MVSSLFDSDKNEEADAPSYTFSLFSLENGYPLLNLIVDCEICDSKSEAKRLIAQGGISINREKITDVNIVLTQSNLENGCILIKKGKKIYKKALFI